MDQILFFVVFSEHNLAKIDSFRLPAHSFDAHRKIFLMNPSKNRIENFSERGHQCPPGALKG